MKKTAILSFLHYERDELKADISLLEAGAREVIEIMTSGRKNVTLRALACLLERLARFEELIAACEARLA